MVCALALILSTAALSQVIDVIGVRRERDFESGPGQTTTISPSRPGRGNISERLRGDAAIEVTQDGSVRASGFVLPSIRNIPGRYADVYIENLQIFDPFLGLPFTDEIDLRAFAAVQLVKGLPPPAVSSLGSSGVIRFRLRDTPERALGVAIGRPHGASGFVLAESGSAQSQFVGRLYLRKHATNGEFRYFDDNNTPYNTNDDSYATRENNDRRATFAMPSGTWRSGPWSLSALGLASDSTGGTPGPTSLRVERRSRIASLGVQRRLDPEAMLHIGLRYATDNQAAKFAEDWQRLETENLGLTAGYAFTGDQWTSRADLSGSEVKSGDAKFSETRGGFSLGWTEAGHLIRARMSARHPELSEVERAVAAEYAYSLAQPHEIYLQLGRAERGPAYVDRFGDGAFIQAADNLKPEIVRHSEAGYKFRHSGNRFGLGIFQEVIEQQILILPVTQPFFRAQNIAEAQSKGIDLTGQATVLPDVTIDLSGLFSTTIGDDAKPLPQSPRIRLVANVEWHLETYCVVNATSRYQDEFFLDRANSQKAPGHLTHDIAVGTPRAPGLAGTLTITNVTDVTANPITAPESGARGKTATSNFRGYPLPGRSLRLDIEYLF